MKVRMSRNTKNHIYQDNAKISYNSKVENPANILNRSVWTNREEGCLLLKAEMIS